MRWLAVNHLSEQPTSRFAKERTAWLWEARSRTSEKGGRHEPTIRLSCPGRARREPRARTGQAVHTGWLAAAPQRFITVQKTVAPSPASKCRSVKIVAPRRRSVHRVLLPGVSVDPGNTGGILTVQRFFPKLRLIRRMGTSSSKLRCVALLLGVIFLAAQFHACVDYQSGPSGSHICPICTPGAWAVPAPAIAAPAAGHVARLEVSRLCTSAPTAIPRSTSPRAPPQN